MKPSKLNSWSNFNEIVSDIYLANLFDPSSVNLFRIFNFSEFLFKATFCISSYQFGIRKIRLEFRKLFDWTWSMPRDVVTLNFRWPYDTFFLNVPRRHRRSQLVQLEELEGKLALVMLKLVWILNHLNPFFLVVLPDCFGNIFHPKHKESFTDFSTIKSQLRLV